MAEGHLNFYKDTKAADYLDQLKEIIYSEYAGKTSDQQYTPRYVIPLSDSVNFSDSVTVTGSSGDYRYTDDFGNVTAGEAAKFDFSDFGT